MYMYNSLIHLHNICNNKYLPGTRWLWFMLQSMVDI